MQLPYFCIPISLSLTFLSWSRSLSSSPLSLSPRAVLSGSAHPILSPTAGSLPPTPPVPRRPIAGWPAPLPSHTASARGGKATGRSRRGVWQGGVTGGGGAAWQEVGRSRCDGRRGREWARQPQLGWQSGRGSQSWSGGTTRQAAERDWSRGAEPCLWQLGNFFCFRKWASPV